MHSRDYHSHALIEMLYIVLQPTNIFDSVRNKTKFRDLLIEFVILYPFILFSSRVV
jgi:hypothetical protein